MSTAIKRNTSPRLTQSIENKAQNRDTLGPNAEERKRQEELLIIPFLSKFNHIYEYLREDHGLISRSELMVLLILRSYMTDTKAAHITQWRVYERYVTTYLPVSFMTFTRVFKRLVKLGYLNPLGHRGAKIGIAEAYLPTYKIRLIDLAMKK